MTKYFLDFGLYNDLNAISVAGSGFIEFPYFATEMARRRRDSTDVMKMAFAEFDRSGDGLISVEEIKSFVSKMENGTSKSEVFEDLVKDFDINRDGYIDYKGKVFSNPTAPFLDSPSVISHH